MIYNIQTLRGFAALGVVLFHTKYLFGEFYTNFFGVEIFFVISGFVMCVVNREEGTDFLARRFIRIAPTYWIVTILFFQLLSMGFADMEGVLPGVFHWIKSDPAKNVLLWFASAPYVSYGVILLKSIFFIPYRNIDGEFNPFILVGWTLNLEVLFYVIFAISRLFSKNYAPLATAAMILLIRYIASRSGDQNLYLTFYGKEIILYFVYGIIIYYLYHFLSRFSFKVPVYFAVAQLAFVCVMFIFYHIFPTWFTAIGGSFSAYAIPYLPALMVLSTLFTSYAGYDVKNIFFNYLGSISYSTYIVHIPIMTFLQQFTKNYPYLDWSKSPIGVAVIVMITLFGAALFYEFIERPLLAGLKRLLRRYSNRVTGLRGLR